jgi:hypothetical protein
LLVRSKIGKGTLLSARGMVGTLFLNSNVEAWIPACKDLE